MLRESEREREDLVPRVWGKGDVRIGVQLQVLGCYLP